MILNSLEKSNFLALKYIIEIRFLAWSDPYTCSYFYINVLYMGFIQYIAIRLLHLGKWKIQI